MRRQSQSFATAFVASRAMALVFMLALAPSPLRAAPALVALPFGDGPSYNERLLDGLRSRGLFDLAERYCRERLAQAELADAERAELTIELARTLAAEAIESPAPSRAPLWRQAESAIDEFLGARPRDSQTLAILLQRALLALAAGELSRQEAEVGGLASDGLEPARTALRDAVSQLKLLDERIAIEIQRQGRAPRGEPAAWTTSQLLSLATNVRFQLARAYRNQALCYLPDSSDRIHALTEAIEQLKPLAELPPETPLAWDSRVDEIACLRLQRDFAIAERTLAAALKEYPPPAVRRRLEAERIRLALDTGALEQALAAAGAPGTTVAADGPELSLARLEAYVAGWSAAAKANTPSKDGWRQAATEQTRRIEQSFGAYWMRRAETLVAATIAQNPGAGNFETLLRAAESYYRGGRLDEALASYDRAARLARAGGGAERAFDPALAAATIAHQQSHWREAIDRFRELSTGAPKHAKADDAHLLAVFDAARLAQRATAAARGAALAEYERLLDEHLRLWPTSSTRGQAAWWLGQARESSGQWDAAIEAYRAIPAAHAQFLPGLEATARALRGLLAPLGAPAAGGGTSGGDKHLADDQRRADARQLASDGAHYFESMLAAPPGQAPPAWEPVRRQAVLWAAEFYLEAGADGPRNAVSLLEASLKEASASESPAADANWRTTARALLAVGLAALGRFDDAGRELAALSAAPPRTLLELSESLARRAAAGPAEARASFSRLQQQSLDAVEPQRRKLDADLQRRLDLARVQALIDAGQYEQGLALLEKLASEHAQDGALQESLAALLSEGATPRRRQGLRKWREVQQRSRPGSPRWFRASFGLAHGQYQLGNKIAAAAAVRLVAKTYPELGGQEMKARFEQLLADSER